MNRTELLIGQSEFAREIENSISYLLSAEALSALETDPYWPKWNAPWWHMALLYELGFARLIPECSARIMVKKLNDHYVHFFPFRESESPQAADFTRVMCHCGLGTIFKVISARGMDPDVEIPWARDWFYKYQMDDGGLNCDEAAYTKQKPKSSLVSTMPPLEAVLQCTRREFTEFEKMFLSRGAEYLLNHRLMRPAGDPAKIIDENWTRLCFPRFYEYDVLRGLVFLVRWARRFGRPLPLDRISDAIAVVGEHLNENDEVVVKRQFWSEQKTVVITRDGQREFKKPVSSFPLLDAAGGVGVVSKRLTAEWNEVRDFLK